MTISWYSISIAGRDPGVATFSGFFRVDNATNLVTGFYETVYGSTNFNNNILVTTGTSTGTTYAGFTIYSTSGVTYDNGYKSGWSQFDLYGVLITTMSIYPGNNTFKLRADSFDAAGGSPVGNNGTVTSGDSVMLNVLFTIALVSDPSCFNEETKILCLNKNLEEEYIPIENLKKGDLIKSYKHGYIKIDLIGKGIMINNPENWNECMYKMEKTESNGLTEDLIVTGGHAILVDDLGNYKQKNDERFSGKTPIIDDKYLLLSSISSDFKKIENNNLYTYYHFILENNGDDDERFGVWANGILTETPSKKQFTDHKYTLL